MDKLNAFKIAARAVSVEEQSIKASVSNQSIENLLLAVDILALLPKNRRIYNRYFDDLLKRAQTTDDSTDLRNNRWVINELADLMNKIDGKLRKKRSLYES